MNPSRSLPRRLGGSVLGVLALALALTSMPLTAQTDGATQPQVYSRTYEFNVLEHESAEALAWEACPPGEKGASCRVIVSSPRSITVTADRATHARIAGAIADAEDVPSSQVFQVILLQAEHNGDAGLERVPQTARRALTDARDFLPYTGYKMLGTALLRTDGHASSIVNGPDGFDYRASLTYRDAAGRDGHRLIVRQFGLERRVIIGAGAEKRIEETPVIGTSFSMRPGETVIVGTSKLEGSERALVVLLTNVQ